MAKILIVEGRTTDHIDCAYDPFCDHEVSGISVAPDIKDCRYQTEDAVNSYFGENSPDIIFVDILAEHAIPLIRGQYAGPIVGINSTEKDVSGADETMTLDCFERGLKVTLEKYLS